MDSLTQVVLGAACGEAAAGRRLGRRALLWGGLAGTLPDLDVLASPFLSEPAALHFHRGPTHSLLFAFVAAPLLGWLVARLHRVRARDDPGARARGEWRPWAGLFFWALWTHPMLDAFTNYGTQLLWPITDHPFAISSVFIIDLAYTLPLLVAVLVAAFRRDDARRMRAVTWGFALSTLYLAWGLGAQAHVRQQVARSLAQTGLPATRMLVEPAPFSTVLWNVIVETRDAAGPRFHVGTYSLLDPDPPPGVPPVGLTPVEARWGLRRPFEGTEALRTLDWFSHGYLVFRREAGGLTACDLRFGRTDGFLTQADAPCIFTFRFLHTGTGATFRQERPSVSGDALAPLWRRTLGAVPAWARTTSTPSP